jgi:hypothetical protein
MLKIIRLSLLTLSLLTVLLFYPLLRTSAPTDIQAAAPLNPAAIKAGPQFIQATALYTLYDGSLGTTPDQQGFFYQAIALTPPVLATQTITNGGTILDTMPDQFDLAGYYNRSTSMPILYRTSGYTVNFTLQVISETHANNNRAGFSITVLGHDSEGIELGFWENQIWAQEDGAAEPPSGTLFTHAEGVTLTTLSLVSYRLEVLSNTYTLYATNSPILSGSLRNYSAFIPPPGFPNPYTSTNAIFLSDNTPLARTRIKLAAVSVNTNSTSLYLPVILKDS